MMPLAKPASSLPQAAVIATPHAAGATTSSPAATPFSALLESHHEGQQHPPEKSPGAAKENPVRANAEAAPKTQDTNRATLPDRSVERQLERNRLNAQREAKQVINRQTTPPSGKDLAKEPARDTRRAAQPVTQESSAKADEPADTPSPEEFTFNPLALLQWIREQATPPAWNADTATAAPPAAELTSAEEPSGDSTEQPGSPRKLNAIQTAFENIATTTAGAWTDKTPGTHTGGPAKLPLASGLLASVKASTLGSDEQQPLKDSADKLLGMGNHTPSMGAMGLEGWARTMTAPAMDSANPQASPVSKVALASQVTETHNTAQALALGPGTNGLQDSTTVSVTLSAPVQSPEFRELLGSQISLLAKDGVQSAELHLNPAEMGPVSVQITLDGTQARVDFGADSAQTRQHIEASLPELASALRDAGLTLSGGGVSQHAHGRENPQDPAPNSPRNPLAQGQDGVDTVARGPVSTRRVALGGVDLYA
jgi:flagellar hook-length control protein FliK